MTLSLVGPLLDNKNSYSSYTVTLYVYLFILFSCFYLDFKLLLYICLSLTSCRYSEKEHCDHKYTFINPFFDVDLCRHHYYRCVC